MTSLEFIYKEIPNTRGNIDKCINITPNEICTLLDKYAVTKVENYVHPKASYQFCSRGIKRKHKA